MTLQDAVVKAHVKARMVPASDDVADASIPGSNAADLRTWCHCSF